MTAQAPLGYVSRPPEGNGGPAPAAILVHGRGADEQDLLPIGSQLPDHVHVFSVRAPIEGEDGYSWYRLDVDQGGLHSSQPDPETFRRSLVRLTKFVAYVAENYPVDPDVIGILGFSQGATLGLSAMTELPQGLDWVVGLNGYLPEEYQTASKLAEARSVGVFLAAGRMDLVVPQERVERARDRLGDVGVDVTYNAYPVGHGADDDEIADVVEWVGNRV